MKAGFCLLFVAWRAISAVQAWWTTAHCRLHRLWAWPRHHWEFRPWRWHEILRRGHCLLGRMFGTWVDSFIIVHP